ncbi:hypothetical protein MJO28_016910, partial [Puccinia striiformis f. sp. tritici]
MNTLVSFSYRNLMSKLSDPHTVPSPEHEQLHGFIVKLEKDQELYYQGKFWSNVKVGQNRGKNLERKLTMRQTTLTTILHTLSFALVQWKGRFNVISCDVLLLLHEPMKSDPKK